MPPDSLSSERLTKENFKDICRSCIQNCGEINIFEIKCKQVLLSELIRYCFDEKASSNGKYPNKVCSKCLKCILYSVVFLRRLKYNLSYVQEIDYILRNDPENLEQINEIIEEINAVALSMDKLLEHEDIIQSLYKTETLLKLFSKSDKEPKIEIKDESIKTPIFRNQDGLVYQTIFDQINENIEDTTITNDNQEPFEIITIQVEPNYSETVNKEDLDTSSETEDSQEDKIKNQLQCFECLETFGTPKNLHDHTKQTGHTIPPRFQCEICSKFFRTAKAFKNHYTRHTKRVKSICDICGASILPKNLNRHLLSHQEKSNICQYCGKAFVQKGTMTLHVRNEHEGKRRVALCCICGKVYSSTTLLTFHLNTHSREELKDVAYGCEQCEKYFISEDSLHVHVQRVHIDPKQSSNINNTRPLKKYKKYVYKPKTCPICSKSISYLGYAAHLRVHNGVKPFNCKICPRTFKQKAHLRTHMSIHSGVKPYKCKFCHKQFRHVYSLRTHERAHKGEKPFKCTVCNKGFYESSPMKKHMRIHCKILLKTEDIEDEPEYS